MGIGGFVSGQILKRVGGRRFSRPAKMLALRRLPTLLRLGYALFRDERVPLWQRALVVTLVGLAFSPVDIPSYIPFIGPFWDFTIAVVVLDAFIQVAPADVVNEHIRSLHLESKIPLRRK